MSTDMIINFVLDQSGSMASVRAATIEGFNTFLREQKEVEGNAWISLTLFNTNFDVRYSAWGIRDLPEMTYAGINGYSPAGGTALFDAVGTTIEGTQRWLDNNKDWFHGKVVCAILTDGQENSSKRFTQEQINDLIKEKQDNGWEFIFLGAGGAKWLEDTFHSVARDQIYSYVNDAGTTNDMYTGYSGALTTSRVTGQSVNSTLRQTAKKWADNVDDGNEASKK